MPSLQRPLDSERLRRWHADTTPQRMLRELASLVAARAQGAHMLEQRVGPGDAGGRLEHASR